MLVDNLSRFNEEEESDRQGIFHVLGEYGDATLVPQADLAFSGIFENILGFNADLSTDLVSKTKILDWLLQRIESPKHDENRGYAAEILSILLQNKRLNRLELGKRNGVETILTVLSVNLRCLLHPTRLTEPVLLALSQKGPCQRRRDRVYGERFRCPLFCSGGT